MPPETPVKTTPPSTAPQAISAPHNFLESGNTPHQFFRNRFGPLMGLRPGEKLYCRNQGSQYFMTGHHEDTIVFPTESPLASRERYAWFVVAEDRTLNMLAAPYPVESFFERPDAVKFGWLVDPDRVAPPSLDERAGARQATIAKETAWAVMMSRLSQLMALGPDDLDAAQKEELAEIRRKVVQVSEKGPDALLPKVLIA